MPKTWAGIASNCKKRRKYWFYGLILSVFCVYIRSNLFS
jgi:hypothetical protein